VALEVEQYVEELAPSSVSYRGIALVGAVDTVLIVVV